MQPHPTCRHHLLLLLVVSLSCVGAFDTAANDGAPADPKAIREALLELRVHASEEPVRRTLPIRLIQRITAWQQSPLSLVLADREPGDPESYPMTHPVFAFEWREGRLLVVDPGLALDEAQAFGATTEWLGAEPIRCNPDAWAPLRAAGLRVEAIVFSHLHTDHTTGVRELCHNGPVPIRLSPEQERSDERFEEAGREQLAADAPVCVVPQKWRVGAADRGVEALEGFPGVYRISVPGHSPGSQILVGFVAGESGVRAVAITGDVVNHRLGFERGVAKPWWYRWFVVREDDDRQAGYRDLLRDLDADGFEVLVDHDLRGATDDLATEACPEAD